MKDPRKFVYLTHCNSFFFLILWKWFSLNICFVPASWCFYGSSRLSTIDVTQSTKSSDLRWLSLCWKRDRGNGPFNGFSSECIGHLWNDCTSKKPFYLVIFINFVKVWQILQIWVKSTKINSRKVYSIYTIIRIASFI